MDAPLIFFLVDREDFTALAAKKHQKNPILRWLINGAGGIWLNRDEPDTHAIRVARDYLQKGGLLGIAPEGTRSRTGALIQAKTGAAYMADKSGVPVVPIAITGTEGNLKRVVLLQRPRIKVVFGQPFMLPPIDRNEREAGLQRNTDEIMCRIAALLPPQYHGAYAEHPRLKELLAQRPASADR